MSSKPARTAAQLFASCACRVAPAVAVPVPVCTAAMNAVLISFLASLISLRSVSLMAFSLPSRMMASAVVSLRYFFREMVMDLMSFL